MIELIAILQRHATIYPLMQPCDVVKLVYQNEFGVGHLISDREYARQYLVEELEENDGDMQIEELGNNFVRVYLSGVTRDDVDSLLDAMVLSTQEYQGSNENFLAKLDVVSDCVGYFSFDKEVLDDYIKEYLQGGVVPVSHSDIYRENYHPHYRVINKNYLYKIL